MNFFFFFLQNISSYFKLRKTDGLFPFFFKSNVNHRNKIYWILHIIAESSIFKIVISEGRNDRSRTQIDAPV